MKTAILVSLAIFSAFISACDSNTSKSDYGDSAESGVTPLSLKAAKVELGMSRSEVIRLLGSPDWVITPADVNKDWNCAPGITLALVWRNDTHYPIIVDFVGSYTVSGSDEGRQEMPSVNSESRLPPNSFSSTQSTRVSLAKP